MKKYRIINLLLFGVMVLGTLGLMVFAYESDRLLTYLAVIPVLLLPCLLLKTKYRLNERDLCFYYLFILLADFLGCVVNLYNLVSWYDMFVHFLSGIFTFYMALFVISKNGQLYDNWQFNLLVAFSFVVAVAGMWEIFEYTSDYVLGMDIQHNLDTGVNDTMVDMIMGLSGGLISVFVFWLYSKNKTKE